MTRGTRDKINEDFWAFHHAHPEVYALFDRFACELLAAGLDRGSSNLIFERIRWETTINPTPGGPVKLNNNYRSRYSRLWEHDNPERKGFFRHRSLNPVSANSVRVSPHERTQERPG